MTHAHVRLHTVDTSVASLTSVVVHMLPEISTQNTTKASFAVVPTSEAAPVEVPGVIKYRTSSFNGTSSGTTISIVFRVLQNSHTHIYMII